MDNLKFYRYKMKLFIHLANAVNKIYQCFADIKHCYWLKIFMKLRAAN